MWKKLFRKRKSQSALIFFVILLCTMLLNGSITMLLSLNQPYEDLKQECETEVLKIYTYQLPDTLVQQYQERFEGLDEVQSVSLTKYWYIENESYMNDAKLDDGYLSMLEVEDQTQDRIRMVDGSADCVQTLADDECLVPACLTNEYHMEIGDTIRITDQDQDLVYTIAGIYADPYSTSTAYSSYVYVNHLPEAATPRYYLSIYAKDGVTADQIQEAYRTTYDGIFFGTMEAQDNVISEGLISIHITAAVFIAIGIIMLIVSGLIINFMVRNAMIADSKSIAVYKTMGYTTNDILKMYLTFYMVVTVAAGLLGIAGSKLLATLILSGIFQNLGKTAELNVLATGIPCVILEIAFVLGICFLIINKTRKVKPVYALNGLQTTNSSKHKYSGNLNAAFSPWGIACRNLVRNKRGIVGIMLTLIVTIFAVNFGMISFDVAFSQKDKNDYWIGLDASDVNITVLNYENYNKITQMLEADDQVEKFAPFYLDKRVYLDWSTTDGDPDLAGFVYDDFDQISLPVTEGRNPQTCNEIALASTAAEECNKRPGDYIEVYLDDSTKVNMLITGIFQTYYNVGVSCRLRTDAYTERNLSIEYNTISVYLKDGVDLETYLSEVQDHLGTYGNAIKRSENQSSIMNMITEPQKMGIPPVIGLVFLISAVNIFCIIMLKNSDHAKMNGIYKCIGYTTKDLILSNIIYVGILALFAFVIAIPISLITYGDIMKLALSVFHFEQYPVTLDPGHLIMVNLAAFGVFIVSTLLSSLSIRRVHVRDLVME